MVITFIGLSGSGKSYLAHRLVEEKGFTRKNCDSLIEERLASELSADGLSGLEGVAEWMGQPTSPTFKARQDLYLHHEREIMQEIIEDLGDDGWGLDDNYVIDTTGSVIYTGEDILFNLKKRSRLVYLSVPESELEFMFQQYLDQPKPVIWGNSFEQKVGESDREALERCYPKLIRSRQKLYQQYADVTFVIDRDNRDRFSVHRLLNLAGAR
jgi:shikimate kinase